MEVIQFKLTGVTPLIVNRFHEEAQEEATSGIHGRHEKLSSHDDAENRLYKSPDGSAYFPAENLRQSIVGAASRHKIGRKSATGDVAAALYLEPFALPLTGVWEVDSRPVVIPATRGRILRHRPIFNDWQLEGRLQFDPRLIDKTLLRKIVDDSGDYVGIGDFRPARRGPYGRFRVDEWQFL
jgi:hypothetical protein